MKLICERTTFIPGFCVFSLHHNGSGVSPHPKRNRLHSVTCRYAEWLSRRDNHPPDRDERVFVKLAHPDDPTGVAAIRVHASADRS
jgi:hypothetical protein